MINSIDMEKALGKIQHLFIIKTLRDLEIERNFLTMMKGIYQKSTANAILNGKRLTAFPLRSRTRQGCHSTLYWKF